MEQAQTCSFCHGSECCALGNPGIGGFNAMMGSSQQESMTLKQPSRPFDKIRDGFSYGEFKLPQELVVREEFDDAKNRGATILPRLLSGGLTQTLLHITHAPHPEGLGIKNVMRRSD